MCCDSYMYQEEVEQDFQRFFVSLERVSSEGTRSLSVQEIVMHWYQEMQQYQIVSTFEMKEHIQQYGLQKNHSPIVKESISYFLDSFLY